MPNIFHQLPLALKLDANATFDNYWVGGNQMLVSQLRELLAECKEHWVYLSGSESSGKSHLLQAVSAESEALGLQAAYVNMQELVHSNYEFDKNFSVELFDAFERYDVLCIDDIQALAGHSQWQEALFYLLVKLKSRPDSRLLLAGGNTPSMLGLSLADLESRIMSATHFRLPVYSDDEKKRLLQFRAEKSGFSLSGDVAAFIMQRYSRDLAKLIYALNKLDVMGLSASRKLTIPFVKRVLEI